MPKKQDRKSFNPRVPKSPRRRASTQNNPVLQEVALVGLRDRFSTYPSAGLTPDRLASIFMEADIGSIYYQAELFEEMLEKDLKLFGLFESRRLAVTRRPWAIIPASDKPEDKQLADEAEALINGISNWKGVVQNILDAVPKGFSVQEIWWTIKDGKYTVSKIEFQHQKKFRFGKITDPYSDPKDLRLIVDPMNVDKLRGMGIFPEDELSRSITDGISISLNPSLRSRFMVSYSQVRSGLPSRTSILRGCGYPWLFKNYDIKWWVQFAERLLGIRIGKYDSSQPEQKEVLISALQSLAYDTAAVITNESSIEFVDWLQKAVDHQVYGDLTNWVDDQYAVAILGHTGSSRSEGGKLGEEKAALEVRADLIDADAQEVLDSTVNNDLINPFIDFNHGTQEIYPQYKTDTTREPDPLLELQIDMGLTKMGFPQSKKDIADRYNRRIAEPGEDLLQPPVSGPDSGGSSSIGGGLSRELGLDTSVAGKKKILR